MTHALVPVSRALDAPPYDRQLWRCVSCDWIGLLTEHSCATIGPELSEPGVREHPGSGRHLLRGVDS